MLRACSNQLSYAKKLQGAVPYHEFKSHAHPAGLRGFCLVSNYQSWLKKSTFNFTLHHATQYIRT